jgi:predicted MFS family arabinose efflux permease
VAPIVGGSIGLGVGGLVGSSLGWRWAFLIVGVPGSLLAVVMWRLPEPPRGGSDGPAGSGEEAIDDGGADLTLAAVVGPPVEGSAFTAMRRDLREVARIRTIRSLVIGTAIGTASLQGMAFWASAFYERHTSLGASGADGVVAVLIALGALVGTFVAGRMVDTWRDRVAGLPMLMAGVAQLIGAFLLLVTFLPVPLWFR